MPRASIILLVSVVVMLLGLQWCAVAQSTVAGEFRLDGVQTKTSGHPVSNSISNMVVTNAQLWIGTGKGVAMTTDFGRSWSSYHSNPAFANDGIFALAARGDTIWASTGYDKDVGGGTTYQTGSGYAFTTNEGQTWTHVNQPLDTCIQQPSINGRKICQNYIPRPYGINSGITLSAVTTTVANVSYDISLTPGTVWVASWSSGLRKSTDRGVTWDRILLPLDNMDYLRPGDPLWYFGSGDTLHQDTLYPIFDVVANQNLKAFAVYSSDGSTVWCGTAGGINRSTDGGESWARFTNKNQVSHILSNWVYRISEQRFGSVDRVWATNWRTFLDIDQPEDYGVSYTADGGRTWKTLLQGIKAYNFAFKDSIAYVTTENGLYRTTDGGESFTNVTSIVDPVTRQVIATTQFITVGVIGDTVYLGTDDGIASTVDDGSTPFGSSWKIYRAYQDVGTSPTTYAYPNPFSPAFGAVRIHYGNSSTPGTRDVSIDLFDFGMNHVRTLLHNARRSASLEYDELWDGKDDSGRIVANGVYFYRITSGNDDPLYGKILLLQ